MTAHCWNPKPNEPRTWPPRGRHLGINPFAPLPTFVQQMCTPIVSNPPPVSPPGPAGKPPGSGVSPAPPHPAPGGTNQ